MKIVIDIPAEDFENVKCGRGAVSMMRKSIIHGTPLPKGHGDLKDADEMKKRMGNLDGVGMIGRCIDEFPIIIEADKAESEDNA